MEQTTPEIAGQDPVVPAGLYIVGTPIGNLRDITLRALAVLRQAGVILAEDTRHTRHLLAHYRINTRLVSCHKFNEAARREAILALLAERQVVALVTDSGMPGISDPGARVVAAARAAEFPVTVVPGPCAVSAALALSGLDAHRHYFLGFLPHKPGPRRRALESVREVDAVVVLFESPYRLLKLLGEIRDTLGERTVFVAREMTKMYEEGVTGTPSALEEYFGRRSVKGELVVAIAPTAKGKAEDPETDPAETVAGI